MKDIDKETEVYERIKEKIIKRYENGIRLLNYARDNNLLRHVKFISGTVECIFFKQFETYESVKKTLRHIKEKPDYYYEDEELIDLVYVINENTRINVPVPKSYINEIKEDYQEEQ